ncbi:MAG: secretion system protein E, partial [Betaproteobacteria bacterium]|nr:secretion system protein E [Betaproteobacteria bacterium]
MTATPAGTAGPAVRAANEDISSLLLRTGAITPIQASRARRIQDKLADRSFLSVLCELGFLTQEQARKILQENRLAVGLGSLLVELGYLKAAELEVALEAQKNSPTRKRLGEILTEKRFIEEHKLLEVLS